MKTLDLRQASKPLAEYTAELDSEPILITSNEQPVAALVSLKGMDKESIALSLSPEFAKIIRRARTEARRGEVFSLDQVKKRSQAAAPNTASQRTPSAVQPRRVRSARKKRSPHRA